MLPVTKELYLMLIDLDWSRVKIECRDREEEVISWLTDSFLKHQKDSSKRAICLGGFAFIVDDVPHSDYSFLFYEDLLHAQILIKRNGLQDFKILKGN